MTNRRGYRGLAALLALLLTLCCAPGALADADGPAQAGTAHAFFQTREGTGARRFGGGRRPEQRALFPDP